jgi:hypothetical protein
MTTKTTFVGVRTTPEFARKTRTVAVRRGLTVSEFVRLLIERELVRHATEKKAS